jgi:hypothetical protein
MQQQNRSHNISFGFGLKFAGNEYKGALSSFYPKRKTKPKSQSNDLP